MSRHSSTADSGVVEDNQIFVDLLAKYKISLRKSIPLVERQMDAVTCAFLDEYNGKCQTNLTMKQLPGKLNNFKSRLRKKNMKNLSGPKHLPFAQWEKRFLELWEGNGITCPKDTISEASDIILNSKLKTEDEILPNLTEIKTEKDDNFMEYGPHTMSERNAVNNEPESDSETEIGLAVGDDNDYDNLSTDELKRCVLIAQMRTLAAQERAARANEKLKLYKLAILQQNNAKQNGN